MLSSFVRKQKHISDIETVVRSHDARLRLLEYKSLDIEARSRRNNLLIYGFTERRNENCTDRIIEFLENELCLDTVERSWIERSHRLGRFDRTKAARPIIVAFSSYHYIESIMANVSRLKGTDYSVNRDFPAEISRARKALWPKLKQIRERYPQSRAFIVYPAKIILDGRVVEDMYPEWDSILRGSRIDASHPSQVNFKYNRSNVKQPEHEENIPLSQQSQSLLPQQPSVSSGNWNSYGTGRSTTVDFNINDLTGKPQS